MSGPQLDSPKSSPHGEKGDQRGGNADEQGGESKRRTANVEHLGGKIAQVTVKGDAAVNATSTDSDGRHLGGKIDQVTVQGDAAVNASTGSDGLLAQTKQKKHGDTQQQQQQQGTADADAVELSFGRAVNGTAVHSAGVRPQHEEKKHNDAEQQHGDADVDAVKLSFGRP